MRTAKASRFFLTLYALLQISHAQPEGTGQCAIDPHATVLDACTTYSNLERLNDDIAPSLEDLTQNTDFFAYYRLNLFNKECPFWNDATGTCGNRACAVDTIEDEENIPLIWRTEELSKLEGARAKHPGPALQKERPKKRPLAHQLGENVDESCVLEADDECDERDYCVPEDEGAAAKGDYVSLVNNTEKFTGYSGESPHMVWDAIYQENCFSALHKHPKSSGPLGGSSAAKKLRNVLQSHGKTNTDAADDLYPMDDECLEQRAFYRIISGMHASISTHLCWDYFNQRTGEWVRNATCYNERLHKHPERVSNIYFNYALVTRAITKLRKHLESYTFCSGDADQDYETKQKILRLADRISGAGPTFDESVMFQDPSELELKDDFKQRFRNVSRLMDCVGCDKCRLWGKVQTAGYGAALKILFEFDETKNRENPYLRRTELVALINTYGRLSHSLHAVQRFRQAINTGDLKALGTNGASGDVAEDSATNSMEETRYSNPITNFESEDEDLDDEPYGKSQRVYPETSIWQEIKAECDLVWRAYKLVMTSWIEMPFKVFAILVMEGNRLWNFWLGLPVPPSSWEFRFPSRDEL